MSEENHEHKYNSIQSLESCLSVIKTLPKEDLDEQYFELMDNAKRLLGDLNPKMGKFYYEYGSYLLDKIEKNGELFGSFKPTKQQKKEKITEIQENDEGEEDQEEGDRSNKEAQHQKGAVSPGGHHICFKGEGVVIEDDEKLEHKPSHQGSATKQQPEGQAKKPQQQKLTVPAEEESEDDEDVCFENLFASFNIFNTQYMNYLNGENDLTEDQQYELIKNIARVRCRLGDYHFIRENFEQARDQFKSAGQLLEKLPNSKTNSHLASVQLSVGNAYLVEGKEGCQQQAIPHLFSAAHILINRLIELTGANNYPIPDATHTAVDRILYLPRWDDIEEIKRLKGLISEVLDKIEDTQIQRKQWKELQKIKAEQKEEQVTENSFKPLPENTNVVNLGTFGNANSLIRRKIPAQQLNQSEGKTELNHQAKRTKE